MQSLAQLTSDGRDFKKNISGGYGMSYLTNILIQKYLDRNQRVFIVETGPSYFKLCKELAKPDFHWDKRDLPDFHVVEIVKYAVGGRPTGRDRDGG